MSVAIPSESVPTSLHNPNSSLQLFNAEQFTRTSALREQATSLSLTTKQGDTITLSLHASAEITHTTYDRFGRTANGQIQVHAETLSVETRREFSLQIEGDLNRRELKDLQKVIKQVDKIVRDLLKGDLDHALDRALKFGNLKSIASLDATIEVRQSFSLEQQLTVERQSLPSPVIDASLPPASTPPSSAVQPVEIQDIPDEDELEVNTKSITGLIDKLRHDVAESGVDRIKLLPKLHNVFSDIFRDITKKHGNESPILAITKLLHNDLVDSLKDEHKHHHEDSQPMRLQEV